ncbi:MAG: hypothetical protein ACSHYB_05170 [Roseibacillus sp.]
MEYRKIRKPLPPHLGGREGNEALFEYFYNSAWALTGRGRCPFPDFSEAEQAHKGSISALITDPQWKEFAANFDNCEAMERRLKTFVNQFPAWRIPRKNERQETSQKQSSFLVEDEFMHIDSFTRGIVESLRLDGNETYEDFVADHFTEDQENRSAVTADLIHELDQEVIDALLTERDDWEKLATRFAYFIQDILTNEESYKDFCKRAKKRTRASQENVNTVPILNGFLSFCHREKRLPEKSELNREANSWNNATAYFLGSGVTAPSIGKRISQKDEGEMVVIEPLFGLLKHHGLPIFWTIPAPKHEEQFLEKSSLTKALKDLGLNGLRASR